MARAQSKKGNFGKILGARLRFILILILFSLAGALEVYSQELYKLQRLTSQITLDGELDEPAWQQVDEIVPVQYEPVFRGEMNEFSRFKIGYDDSYIYVAGELNTRDASSITINTLARDQYSADDIFAFVVDPFNDNQNALWFLTNPAGVRFDVAISNDANFGGGSSPMNGSWNTFWDVATTKDGKGWYAEMRIPFSSIGFQLDDDGNAEMGIIIYRYIASLNERHIYPAIEPNWNLGMAKPSQALDVQLSGVEAAKPLYVTPYGIGGYSTFNSVNDAKNAYDKNTAMEREIGLDVKYNLTSDLTLDVTVNTDFAQVEADDQQLNFTRFSLFFPEKRQFFQERAGLFNVSLGRNRLFYSRRIGLGNDGNPVRILGGARVTGRVGNWDVGFINMQTGNSDILPSENFGVIRVLRETTNELSKAGGILTSRMGTDGSSNYVIGADSETNIFGRNFMEFTATKSIDSDYTRDEASVLNSSVARIGFNTRDLVGFNYRIVASRTGENFDPGIGYIRRTGTTDTFVRLAYGWFARESSPVNRYNFDVTHFTQSENGGMEDLINLNKILDRSIFARFETVFKQAGTVSFRYNNTQELLKPEDDFTLLGQIYIPDNTYNYDTFSISYSSSETTKLQGQLSLSYGKIYDGSRLDFNASPSYNVNSKLRVSGAYTITRLNFPELTGRNATDFTAHLAQIRAQFAFNKIVSASSFIQYSNVEQLVGANFRLRVNFSEGRDLWFVFNEQLNTERNYNYVEYTPLSKARTILLKYSHTFIF